jgi:hypothetical protein
MFNPNSRVDSLALADGSLCYVVDDLLLEPQAAVRYAADRREQFQPGEPGGYPGITLALPAQMGPAILNFFAVHMQPRFKAGALMHGMCRFSMVTFAPSELQPTQMLCHRDEPVGSLHHAVIGAVLYLFEDKGLGGTSFNRPARPRDEIDRLFGDSKTMLAADFARSYGLPRACCIPATSWRRND